MNLPDIKPTTTSIIFMLLALFCTAANPSTDDYITTADSYINTRPDRALALADSAIAEFDNLTALQTTQLYKIKGNALFALGNINDAAEAFHDACQSARAANDTIMLIDALSDLGVTMRVSQQPDSALHCYNEALALMRKADTDDADEAHLLISIAILFTNTGRISEAVPYAREALTKAESSGDIETLMYAGSQAGIILYTSGEKEEGLTVERRIVDIAQANKLPRYILKTYASIIDMHYKDGRNDSVTHYIEKGRKILPQVPANSVEALGFLEESYVILTAMGKYKESLDIQLKILGMKDAGTYMPIDKLWLRIARNYQGLGNIELMGKAYERSIATADSLRSLDIDNQLSEFDIKYQTAQRELEITRLEADKSRMRSLITLWCAIAAIAILSGYFLVRRHVMRTRIREHLHGIEQERTRLARDLHDGVCNDLLGMGLLLESSHNDTTALIDELKRIRDDVRHISHELMPPQFTNSTLDELLKDYAHKSNGGIGYHSSGSDNASSLPDATAYELYRIIQELTGNIRKHTDATRIEITARFAPEHTDIDISHTGHDMTASIKPTGGIGLTTIRRRAELIHAHITDDTSGDKKTIHIRV